MKQTAISVPPKNRNSKFQGRSSWSDQSIKFFIQLFVAQSFRGILDTGRLRIIAATLTAAGACNIYTADKMFTWRPPEHQLLLPEKKKNSNSSSSLCRVHPVLWVWEDWRFPHRQELETPPLVSGAYRRWYLFPTYSLPFSFFLLYVLSWWRERSRARRSLPLLSSFSPPLWARCVFHTYIYLSLSWIYVEI